MPFIALMQSPTGKKFVAIINTTLYEKYLNSKGIETTQYAPLYDNFSAFPMDCLLTPVTDIDSQTLPDIIDAPAKEPAVKMPSGKPRAKLLPSGITISHCINCSHCSQGFGSAYHRCLKVKDKRRIALSPDTPIPDWCPLKNAE